MADDAELMTANESESDLIAAGEEAGRSQGIAPDFEPAEVLNATPLSAVASPSFAPLAPLDVFGDSTGIELILDVSVEVSVELGRAQMSIGDVMALRASSVVELDKLAGEPADILVNGTLVARGEVVVVDEKFGVRVLDVESRAKRLTSLDR